MSSRRFVSACLVALACVGVNASLASALTVSPAGTYVATGSGETFTMPTNGQSLVCTGARKSMTIAADGTGSVAAGSATYSGCRNALIGAWTVTQAAAWAVQVELLASPLGVALRFTIPARGISFAGSGCTFTLSGTFTKLASVASLPATITSTTGLPVIASTLRIDGNNGGLLCSFFPVGLIVTYRTTLRLDRAMTVS